MAAAPLLQAQAPESIPYADDFAEGTNLLLPMRRVEDLMRHLPEEVYNLTPESHLMRLAKVLLGEAGIGGLRKRMLMARLQTVIQGSHFYDLDRFYGALFGVKRRSAEVLSIDPYNDVATQDEWNDVRDKDTSYRSRVEQFARAIAYCPSPTGMELVAEALLNVDCDIYESFRAADIGQRTYGDVEALGTYGALEVVGSYGDIEGIGTVDPVTVQNRWVFTVVPKRPITEEERYDLLRVLSILKPAHALMKISALGESMSTPITLRGVAADSELWEIRTQILPAAGSYGIPYLPDDWEPNNPQPIDVNYPPFAAYQGEAWSYSGSIVAVSAYTERPVGLARALPQVARYRLPNGSWVDYTPDEAVMPLLAEMAGRSVSDGILTSHPFDNRTGWQQGKKVAPASSAWSDGIPVTPYGPTNRLPTGANQTTLIQRFWPTPERSQNDITWEILEVVFDTVKTVNHLQYEVSRFPCAVATQAYNESTGQWDTIWFQQVTDSVPAAIPAWSPQVTGHPQHALSNHWVLTKTPLKKEVKARRFRIVMQRYVGTAPIDKTTRKPLAYSLAIRNLSFGVRGDAKTDFGFGLYEGLTPSVDAFGSQVLRRMHEEKANGVLVEGGQWRCEPQPVANAVVNFYADTRDVTGDGQVIDRFYMDPTHTGVHCSIYHSDDDVTGIFSGSTDPLKIGVIETEGDVAIGGTGISFGDAASAYLDVPNEAIQWDAMGQTWWIGMEFTSGFASGVADYFDVLAFGTNAYRTRVRIENNTISVRVAANASHVLPISAPWAANTRVKLLLAYEPITGTLSLRLRHEFMAEDTFDEIDMDEVIEQRPEVLRIGGTLSATPASIHAPNITLHSFVLKVGQDKELASLSEVLDTEVPAWVATRTDPQFESLIDNAILRFAPEHYTDDNPFGFEGGPGDFWDYLSWTPVAREYQTQKGFLRVPPTKARYWKFEFTNLAVEPYESFLPIRRVVKVFPLGAVIATGTVGRVTTTTPGQVTNPWTTPGVQTLVDQSRNDATSFYDWARGVNIFETSDVDITGRSLASSLYIKDLNAGVVDVDDINAVHGGWLMWFSPWHQGQLAPKNVAVGPHIYETRQVDHKNKVGYFVGLKGLVAHRVDFQIDDDSPVYVEHFEDMVNWQSMGQFSLDPNDMHTDGFTEATALSKVFQSGSALQGVQFATRQSDAVQVLPDSEFRDPVSIDSTFEEPTSWHRVGDATLAYSIEDFTITVKRSATAEDIAELIDRGLNQDLPTPVFAIGQEDSEDTETNRGGIESPLAPVSQAGRVYAAVRLMPLTDLDENPVYLEIRGSEGTLLASKQVIGRAGEVIEAYVGYTIGSYDPGPGREGVFEFSTIVSDLIKTVGDFEPLDDASDVYVPPADIDNSLCVRVVQYGVSADSWKVDSIALFDDSILWEFSNDGGTNWSPAYEIRNNANGLLTFPNYGKALRWRVTAFRDNLHVNALQVRPRYFDRLQIRTAGPHRGPNVSTFDHEPPIQDDPEFNTWPKPIPRLWFLEGKRYPKVPPPGAPPTTEESTVFGRQATDDVSGFTEAATLSGSVFNRYGYDEYDPETLPHAKPEVLPVPVDTATRTGSVFNRTVSEDIPLEEEATSSVSEHEDDPINKPPFGPPV